MAVALPPTACNWAAAASATGEPSFVIAEIGNNHNGDIGIALQLIDAAHAAGADCAKFQMQDMSKLYSNAGDSNDMASDLGTQYTLDLLERFQLSDDELFRCFDYAAGKGLVPLCTPWDETSLEKLNRWGMEGFKVASADFTNHALISQLATTGKPLICSTGMASELEIRSGIRHLQQEGELRVAALEFHVPHTVQGCEPSLPGTAAGTGGCTRWLLRA